MLKTAKLSQPRILRYTLDLGPGSVELWAPFLDAENCHSLGIITNAFCDSEIHDRCLSLRLHR